MQHNFESGERKAALVSGLHLVLQSRGLLLYNYQMSHKWDRFPQGYVKQFDKHKCCASLNLGSSYYLDQGFQIFILHYSAVFSFRGPLLLEQMLRKKIGTLPHIYSYSKTSPPLVTAVSWPLCLSSLLAQTMPLLKGIQNATQLQLTVSLLLPWTSPVGLGQKSNARLSLPHNAHVNNWYDQISLAIL